MVEAHTPQGATGPYGLAAALIANLFVLAVALYAGLLERFDPDFYYVSLQEDEYLEWATFWAFMGAAAIFAVRAARRLRGSTLWAWFPAGLSLLCFFVAMEEISWGQRLVGYRPPVYFLEHNFQQELNVHNILATDLRKLTLKAIIAGYGVVLPLLVLARPGAWLAARAGVVAPPVALAPAFALTYALYEWYPWSFTGETVELMLGLSFLFAAVLGTGRGEPGVEPSRSRLSRPAMTVAAVWAGVLVLGLANAAAGRIERRQSPELLEWAGLEADALGNDFVAMGTRAKGRIVTRCDLHKRVYSYETKYDKPYLYDGEFADLTVRGLPEERAAFFLDPWNSPYWIRDRCDSDLPGKRSVFVYSFGPNRRRDSSRWEILGDDVGAYIHSPGDRE